MLYLVRCGAENALRETKGFG
ncbi:hypothetical protein SBBP1_850012 [Burkholderiales bacterium]|nr:hypothetical protein SBBP1_850012 [Burkholderiales bacterium]